MTTTIVHRKNVCINIGFSYFYKHSFLLASAIVKITIFLSLAKHFFSQLILHSLTSWIEFLGCRLVLPYARVFLLQLTLFLSEKWFTKGAW